MPEKVGNTGFQVSFALFISVVPKSVNKIVYLFVFLY